MSSLSCRQSKNTDSDLDRADDKCHLPLVFQSSLSTCIESLIGLLGFKETFYIIVVLSLIIFLKVQPHSLSINANFTELLLNQIC